jgi:zinc/manganese transport system substrate-binding protein
MPSRRHLAAVTAAAGVALAGVAGCGGSSAAAGGPVRVVAAENVWGNITAQIGGKDVHVTSIIRTPNTDPHTYQSDVQDAAAVSSAALVIENGLGYDSFVDSIVKTGSSGPRRVLSVQRTLAVTGENPNPHLWYWTSRLPRVAAAIAHDLAAIDPAHAASYRTGAQRFDRSLRPLLATIATIRHRYAGTRISYTERVPGYLVQAAGLVLGTPASFSQAIEDGNDPSPQDAARFDADITAHRVKVLLYNSQVVDPQTTHIKALATEAGVPVVGVSETLPPSYPTFQAWQLAQDRALLDALSRSSS